MSVHLTEIERKGELLTRLLAAREERDHWERQAWRHLEELRRERHWSRWQTGVIFLLSMALVIIAGLHWV